MENNSLEEPTKQQIKKLLDRFKQLKADRSNWNNSWQVVAMYVNTKKADFTTSQTDGQFLNTQIFDNSASQFAKARASTLKSMILGNYDFKLTPADKFKDSDVLIKFFDKATEILKNEMKNPLSSFDKSITEAEDFDAIFGTSIMYSEFVNDKTTIAPADEVNGIPARILDNSYLSYKTLDLKECYIDEDFTGNINQLFREYQITVKEAVEEFGLEKLHSKVQEQFRQNETANKLTIVNAIIPIGDYINLFPLKNDFQYISFYIDTKNNHLIHFSGYNDKPFFVHRENKKTEEKYGRSVSMEAISTISLLNKIGEDIITIFNRYAQPPLGLIDNKAIIDTSAGSVTVFDPQIQNPIFNMINEYGDVNALIKFRETLKDELSNFYGIDKLLDFNNQTQMTATEVRQRAMIRNQTMSYLFSSKTNERYSPLIERSFNLLLLNDYFKNLLENNEELAELFNSGEDLYTIEYYNQVEREKNSQDNLLIMNIWNTANSIAQMTQDISVFDNLNADQTISLLKNISFTNSIFRGSDEVEQIRINRQEQQQAMLQAQLQQGQPPGAINE